MKQVINIEDYNKVSDSEYKKLLLNMMSYFHGYCQARGLTYYLFYGTLIGAVRHDGFIPWDDDVDIIMPRADYEKLSKDYGLKEPVNLGVYIDLFVLDGMPEHYEEAVQHEHRSMQLAKSWLKSNTTIRANKNFLRDIVKYILYTPYRLRSAKFYLGEIQKNAVMYEYGNSDFVGNLIFPITCDMFFKEDFNPVLHRFEENEFYIPAGYERILLSRYGNWKELPPVESQVGHHNYSCFVRKNSK